MKKRFQTEFAPAERATGKTVAKQAQLFKENSIINEMANSIPNLLLILNHERQVVFANKNFISLLQIQDINDILGKRPGEILNCIHSGGEGGCGTTQFCSKCGAVNAILESQNNIKSVKECRILTANNEALDFTVVASPYKTNGTLFTVFALSDISDEKRRQILERVFFHDVINTAGGISGLSEVLQYVDEPGEQKELLKLIHVSSVSLIDEIKSQQQLNSAERGILELELSEFSIFDAIQELTELYSHHPVIQNRMIKITDIEQVTTCFTDKVLLKRVLGNMIKNALEASANDGIVTVSAIKKANSIVFSVHNSTYIPKDVQLQLFKRSFSTKGNGRGIGTYSIKLFGEKYLKGEVRFESSEEGGTSFFLKIPCS